MSSEHAFLGLVVLSLVFSAGVLVGSLRTRQIYESSTEACRQAMLKAQERELFRNIARQAQEIRDDKD